MLGHELTHIRNGDVRMMVVAVVIAGVISFFGELVFRLFFQASFYGGGGRRSRRRGDRKGGAGLAIIIALALIAVAWILSIVIQFALSRQREYLADAGSVELTKNPDAMISALRKIEGRGEITGRHLGGDGNVHRQSARGIFQHFRHASVGRRARRRAGQVRRRPRSRPTGDRAAAGGNAHGSSPTGRRPLGRPGATTRRAAGPVGTPRPIRQMKARGARNRARTLAEGKSEMHWPNLSLSKANTSALNRFRRTTARA